MDTSSLIDAEMRFPQASNPELWQRLHTLAVEGRMAVPRQVLDEISPKNRPLRSRVCERRADMAVDSNEDLVALAADVSEKFPGLVDLGKPGPRADPHVVALAAWLQKNSVFFECRSTIVTEEADRPDKIPRAALRYGIPSTNFRGLLCKEGWQ